MGYWKENLLGAVVLFGVIGALLHSNMLPHSDGFITTPDLTEYGCSGTILWLILYNVITIIYVGAYTIYAMKWWIVCPVLIIWWATWASKKECES